MLHASVRSSTSSNKADSSSGNFTRQGSLRKVLPGDHSKLPKLGYHNEEAQKVYKVFHQEYSILAEYKMLQSENLRGIYVIPSKESSFVWFGVVFVRSGLYEDGIFRFIINLPDTFPDCEHPKVIFTSRVFHPVIDDETRELNLKHGFPEWKKGEQHIWQILKYICWVFENVPASFEHAIDQDAANMYKFDNDAFKLKVEECVKESIDHVYDPPPVDDKHYLIFEPYQPETHDPVRQAMLNPKNDDSKNSPVGHSWVASGTFKPLTNVSTTEIDS